MNDTKGTIEHIFGHKSQQLVPDVSFILNIHFFNFNQKEVLQFDNTTPILFSKAHDMAHRV